MIEVKLEVETTLIWTEQAKSKARKGTMTGNTGSYKPTVDIRAWKHCLIRKDP